MTLRLSVVAQADLCHHLNHPSHAQKRAAMRSHQQQLLQQALSLPPDTPLRYHCGEHGKPYLSDFPQWQFNLSHSQHHHATLYGLSPCELGIDIESTSRSIRPAVIAASLCPREHAVYLNCADPHRYWLQVWTIKEAVLKAAGLGIQVDLQQFDSHANADTNTAIATLQQQPYRYHCLSHPDWQLAIAWQHTASMDWVLHGN